MFEVFKSTLSPMLTMFTCIIIGYILNKSEKVPENTATVLSKCENYFILPALSLGSFIKYCSVESLKENYSLILYAVGVLALALIIGTLLSCLFSKDEYKKNIYKYSLTIANFGFMGNAIVPMILGEEMLYKYLLFTLPLSATVYTWGIAILTPKSEKKESPLKRIINPTSTAMIAGIIIGVLGIGKYLPKFFLSAIGNISACMGPLAMVLTGFVIAQYDFLSMLKNGKVYVVTFLRLVLLPLIFVTILRFVGAEKEVILLAFIAFGTPLGLNTVVFPAVYGGDTKLGASMAMISHTLCIITIPILYSLICAIC